MGDIKFHLNTLLKEDLVKTTHTVFFTEVWYIYKSFIDASRVCSRFYSSLRIVLWYCKWSPTNTWHIHVEKLQSCKKQSATKSCIAHRNAIANSSTLKLSKSCLAAKRDEKFSLRSGMQLPTPHLSFTFLYLYDVVKKNGNAPYPTPWSYIYKHWFKRCPMICVI